MLFLPSLKMYLVPSFKDFVVWMQLNFFLYFITKALDKIFFCKNNQIKLKIEKKNYRYFIIYIDNPIIKFHAIKIYSLMML